MKNSFFLKVKVNVSMKNKRKLTLGIFICIFLALLMVRNLGLIKTDSNQFFSVTIFGLFVSYQIVAFLFGWLMPMLTFTGGLKKGENDLLRFIMFVFFIGMWFFLFFR